MTQEFIVFTSLKHLVYPYNSVSIIHEHQNKMTSNLSVHLNHIQKEEMRVARSLLTSVLTPVCRVWLTSPRG